MLTADGAQIERVGLRLGEGGGGAQLQLRPSPAGSSHAMLTLRPDGPPGGVLREVRLACAPPCALQRPREMAGASDVWRVKLTGEVTVVSLTG